MCLGCFEISVSVLLYMFKVLESSGLFVCLGRLEKIFSAWGDRRNCWVVVFWREGEISTQADTMSLIKFINETQRLRFLAI